VQVRQPALAELLAFCAESPVERVFLEDLARRGLGRFTACSENNGRLTALCHVGANAVPAGGGCEAFAGAVAARGPRMIVGEEGAVRDLWGAVRRRVAPPRQVRPGQPAYVLDEPPPAGRTRLRRATRADLGLLLPACAAAHQAELGVDPLTHGPSRFRRRTESQIQQGRSWLWEERGTILFKAEASAWTQSAVQLQQVWFDPRTRRKGYALRGLRDLCRLLLRQVPAVCLFVRAENAPAIGLYERVGMRREGSYRSILL